MLVYMVYAPGDLTNEGLLLQRMTPTQTITISVQASVRSPPTFYNFLLDLISVKALKLFTYNDFNVADPFPTLVHLFTHILLNNK